MLKKMTIFGEIKKPGFITSNEDLGEERPGLLIQRYKINHE